MAQDNTDNPDLSIIWIDPDDFPLVSGVKRTTGGTIRKSMFPDTEAKTPRKGRGSGHCREDM